MNLARRLAALVVLFVLLGGQAWAQFGGKSHLTPSLVAETTAIKAGQPFTVGILYKIDPEWHIYWQHPGQSGAAPTVAWELPPGFSAGPLQWPLPKLHEDGDLVTNIYEGEVMLTAQITPPAQLPPGEATLKAKLTWFICSKFCTRGEGAVELKLPTTGNPAGANAELFRAAQALLPKGEGAPPVKWETGDSKELRLTISSVSPEQKFEFYPLPPEGATPGHATIDEAGLITVPIETPAPAGGEWHGLLVEQRGEVRQGWYVAQSGRTPPAVAAAAPSTVGGETPPVGGAAPAPRTLLSVLFLAFVGGLILNVMPCVLPVIALKIFGFVKQAGQAPERVFRLGLSFVAGVFAFFLFLATIAVVLHASGHSLNWGSQFQNPYLLAGLIALIFVFSLNLLGVFEITLAGSATSTLSELSSREGYGGAFLHGLFTTLLGTSCTAPFLAVSIGYAVTQPAPVVYLLFATVALGMSLPYFLLTAFPRWMKFLPKPGVWMDRFKQATGFIMLAVAVWLYSVMAGSRPGVATQLSWYLLALGVACWMMGAFPAALTRWLLFPLVVIGGYYGILHTSLQAPLEAKGSNLEQRVADAIRTGSPVFVDFTASWCANCKVFERTVLHTDEVRAAFAEKKVVTVIADWTNPDPEIEKWLQRFGRAGVPLYLLYRPGEAQPVVMDSLTTSSLLRELAVAPGASQTTVRR